MREFVIRRLRRAPVIEPLWNEYERMQAALQAALETRDTALAEREAAVAAREAAIAETSAAFAARDTALAEREEATAAWEAAIGLALAVRDSCLAECNAAEVSWLVEEDRLSPPPVDTKTEPSVALLRNIMTRRRPRVTAAIVGGDPDAVMRMSCLLHAAGLRGLLIIIRSRDLGLEQTATRTLTRIKTIELDMGQPQRLKLLIHNGPAEPLIVALSKGRFAPELIVLPDPDAFGAVIATYSKLLLPRAALPDITVLTDDLKVTSMYWDDPAGHEKVIFHLTAEVFTDLIYFSNRHLDDQRARYGMMVATFDDNKAIFSIEGYSIPNARTGPTILIFRSLLEQLGRQAESTVLMVQYDDVAHKNLLSVAYGRQRGHLNVSLMPDPYFLLSKGFEPLRNAALEHRLPPWEVRRRTVFWRGSATTNFVAVDGTPAKRHAQIPRIAMCLALKDVPGTDTAIINPWLLDVAWGLKAGSTLEWLHQYDIFRPAIPMLDQANYRFLIDIDGVANAWSFVEKLLLGACILKVQSPFEQWFYREITAWRHFVPVKYDLSDLIQKIDWCQQHESETLAIAERGQQFALRYTYEDGWETALRAAERSLTR